MARKKNVVEETGAMDPVAFIKAVKGIVEEKNISEDVVFEAMELALATAYKKNFGSKTNVRVDTLPALPCFVVTRITPLAAAEP